MPDNKLLADQSSREALAHLFGNIATDKLPSLPHVLLRLLDASFTETIAFDQLSDLIKQDAALCGKIVSAASSAYYGGQGRNLTFERILVLLGIDTLKTIAITASVQQFFSRFESFRTRHLKRFWRDSLTCALIAKSIAKLTGYRHTDEAYLAGLLHNIGELLFVRNFAEEFKLVCEQASDRSDMLRMEEERFGGNRYQAGGWLISEWKLESLMADAVLYQNESVAKLQEAHQLVKIIYLANLCCDDTSAGLSDSTIAAAEQLFDFNHELISELVKEAGAHVDQAAKSMGIIIDREDQSKPGQGTTDSASLSVDELKQVELADRVRNIALIDGFRQQLSRSVTEKEVLKTIQKGLNILFGVQCSFFFMLNPDDRKLVGRPVHESDGRIEEFAVNVDVDQDDRTLLARCFRENSPLSSFSRKQASSSVLDRQLIKMTGCEGIYCLPLRVDHHELGVLVVGFDQPQKGQQAQLERLMGMFAREAAWHLHLQQQQLKLEREREQYEQSIYLERAREIAHEVNNPLSIIKNYVHILSSKLEEDHKSQEDLVIIKEELDRAGSILLRLPGIASPQFSKAGEQLVDVNWLIAELLKVFSSSLFATHNIELEYLPDENMLAIECDRNALKQIMTNLVKNAVEALPDKGKISISTQGMVNHNGKSFVGIMVSDNGPGIDTQIQTKLFTPVDTTKGGGHAGLGLAIVKNLVEQMDGSISCRSNPATGTRFEILLPRRLGK